MELVIRYSPVKEDVILAATVVINGVGGAVGAPVEFYRICVRSWL